ncbi:amino acid adenylation domain-containing protein [Pedobacter sp. ok626]|uniref:non-ribosomal peptide synthetase n=1 Tax=Pedobacter sp. ok626 TaxID=1761882 RepID=UPI00088AEB6D|nr:non-ribosomal peptide synthetase [Pedobacter sp. ok626]SDJ55952.1 amino acid adenylation domain-containing protein [Pedobacter sp. ok626]
MSNYTLTPINFNPFEEEKEIDKIVFTNEPQKEIWLSCIIGGDASNLAYNESVSIDFNGMFYPEHFLEAIKKVVQRHEALRATISANGETLIIYKNIPFEISVEDISTQVDQKSILDTFIADQMQYVFDLQEGPLFKSYLHKLNETHYFFTIVKHHIIGDGWSTGVILEDLSKLYNAKVRDENLSLPPAPQISKYAKEMAAFKFSPAYQLTQDYWLNMYKNEVPILDLPTDFPRPALRTYNAHRIDSNLPLALISQLKEMGARAGCSLVNTLLSAFEVFLYLQTNQDDIVVGLPAAGQSATGDFGLVGHCVNLLPLRSIIDTNSTFKTYLKNRKSAFFDAYEHQQFTYGQLVKQLNLKRDHSRIPLVPVVFNIDMGMDNLVDFDHLNYQLISNPRAYETFEIFLNATGSKTAFTFEWSYNTQLFKPETIARMAREFELLLQMIVKDPDVIIKEIALGNTGIWKEQLAIWNNTYSDYPKDEPFMSLIDKYELESPQKTAVVYKNESLNYIDLIEQSNQLANYLIDKGIKVGDIIALASDRSIDMLICLLGILKSGAVYVPLDPEYPQDRIEFMLSDSNAKFLMVSRAYAGKFKSIASELVIEDLHNEVKHCPKKLRTVQVTGEDLAYILYTSGSTGKPKGVQIKHHNLMNFLISMQSEPGITQDDRLLAITTISFDIAGLELYLPLISGAELFICDTETARDGRLLLDLIKSENITFMQATPSTWRMMIDSGWTKSPLLKVLCGGEALPKELAEILVDKSAELWNMYGPTETTIWSTIKKIQKENLVLTIGHPIQNTQIYILNEENNLLAPGITGEIFIGGEGVAAGYLNRIELTKERFITDTFGHNPDGKLYKTGDLGKFLENGEILYQGRIDQQIKIRGHRIELGEIETLLAEQKEIKQAVVIAKEDNLDHKRLVAYVILVNHESTNNTPSWKDRWDTIYDMAAKSAENSAPSDKKIDGILLEQWENSEDLVKQAAEWLQVSADRIKALNAKHILEIGSGGGQLLFELAPNCESYMATDYAETAIEELKQKLAAAPEKWKHVAANANAADDFSKLIGASFDLILIHSVAQYFPDTAYFLKVIEESVKRLSAGGCLFIGDMQGKNSLTMYHAMDHLSHAKNETTLSEFKEVVNNRVRIEDEFVADPGFFYLLPKLLPNITGVDVQLRKGQSQNETTKYHYDVWIYVNSEHTTTKPDHRLLWEELKSIDLLEQQLQTHQGQIIEVRDIFNERTIKDYALVNWMSSADDHSTLLEIKKELQEPGKTGVNPDLFWRLGQQYGYHSHVRWSTDGTDGNFDIVFIPDNLPMALPEPPSLELLRELKPSDFARTPLSTNEVFLSKSMTEHIKDSLRKNLPDYMIPGDFVALKAFPLTPNHKIDKNALPQPQSRLTQYDQVDEKLNEHEKIILDIWASTLGLENIHIKDDFFELGGHSLLAVKVMAAIEKETGKRLPLATLFENSTIESLAKKIQTNASEKWQALVPIRTKGTKDPIFLIHGGGLNVLLFKTIGEYLDEDQPVYGIQALGLNHEMEIPNDLTEIAAHYVSEILKVNPNGPYLIAGYSLGGFIAFEIAKQLSEMGKIIKLLGVMDTYAGNQVHEDSTYNRILRKVKRQFFKIPVLIKSFIEFPKESFSYQQKLIKFKIRKIFIPDATIEESIFTDYEKAIYKQYDRAHNNYKLTPFDVKITLFRAKKRLYYLDDMVYLGWSEYAKKGIDIYEVPGDHKTFLLPPMDKEFAMILQKALNS